MTRSDPAEAASADLTKLLILGLVRSGITQSQIAAALGMHQTSLSRMFPKGLLTEIARSKGKRKLEVVDGQQTLE